MVGQMLQNSTFNIFSKKKNSFRSQIVFYQNFLYGINMYFEVILPFSKQLDLSYRELGRLSNILYEKDPFLTLSASLICKNWQLYFYRKTFIMRYHGTILAGIHVELIFFGTGLGFVNLVRSDPI